ncbi:MAG TPA: GNAT family N-acetyltransferase [Armatimonadota bacterium]|jgi:GNAT superfamily N-acetyltransferase
MSAGGESELVDLKARLFERQVREVLAYAVGFPTDEKMARICEEYQADPGLLFVGYLRGDQVLACAALRPAGPDGAWLERLAVTPLERRRGLGRQLLWDLVHLSRLRWVEAETDDDAVGFYRACGFEVAELAGQPFERARYRVTLRVEGDSLAADHLAAPER